APIDLLSFISLYKKDWQEHGYLTLNGVSDKAILHKLECYPHLQTPILCLDNDSTGTTATNRISEKLKQLGYDNVSQLLPVYKDWNLELQYERAILREPVPEIEDTLELSP
ncbi:toprim domain-containing protein, partial [Ruminococcaceae bacterium OttesenSCG-928-L11]|nr:toprim domain-containing protein [Ruminococcaceae bacterium OttesenSCG-928-L11]